MSGGGERGARGAWTVARTPRIEVPELREIGRPSARRDRADAGCSCTTPRSPGWRHQHPDLLRIRGLVNCPGSTRGLRQRPGGPAVSSREGLPPFTPDLLISL